MSINYCEICKKPKHYCQCGIDDKRWIMIWDYVRKTTYYGNPEEIVRSLYYTNFLKDGYYF